MPATLSFYDNEQAQSPAYGTVDDLGRVTDLLDAVATFTALSHPQQMPRVQVKITAVSFPRFFITTFLDTDTVWPFESDKVDGRMTDQHHKITVTGSSTHPYRLVFQMIGSSCVVETDVPHCFRGE